MNTKQTSPEKIIPEKYLIKTDEFYINNNPKKIFTENQNLAGKNFIYQLKKMNQK